MEKFNWIKEHILNRKAKNWNHISDILPNIFDEYYLVHWKVGILDNFPFDEYPEQNETIEQTNERIRIERAFGLFLNPDKDKLLREINLKEISGIFKKPYDYKLLNNIKDTPGIEVLEKESKTALKKSLTRFENGQLLNFFVEDIYRLPIENIPKQEFIEIDIEKYLELQEDFNYDFCTYLFPDDLSWCLTTSEDMPMFICINGHLKNKLRNEFTLETFSIGYKAKLY